MEARYVIATIVMLNNSYIPGAIALGKSLRKNPPSDRGRKIDTICLVTEGVDIEALKPYWDQIQMVSLITTSFVPGLNPGAEKLYPWMAHAPTKWQILGLTRYEKVLFIDADMIVLTDIGSLFNLDTPAAIFDHPSSTGHVSDPRWTGKRERGAGFINWYYQDPPPVPTGMKISRQALDRLRLNANHQFAPQGSLVLLKPDQIQLKTYMKNVSTILKGLQMPISMGGTIPGYKPTTSALSGTDETSIALFMHDQGKTWTNIGMDYGVTILTTYDIYKGKAKILHFNGYYKPWRLRPDGLMDYEFVMSEASKGNKEYLSQAEAVQLWWSFYTS